MPTYAEYLVVSDFNPNDDTQYSSLEVAILSRYPLTNAVEFDRGTDGDSRSGCLTERKQKRVNLDGIADVGVGRGFLAADGPALGRIVAVTHLKSSSDRSGDVDCDNTLKRELVAAAMAWHVAAWLDENPGLTAVVGGNLNVDETNGYDDTHALLARGLVDGLRLRSLTRELGNTSDDTPGDRAFPYPRVGAIDVPSVGAARASLSKSGRY
ncbi:endonuclease/exonuclease/phosphatase family protein [Alienimonas californiensis]|nr:hypothetical protein [Alienimonas californiensis]